MKTINEEISSKFNNEQHRGLVNLVFTSNLIIREQCKILKNFDMTLQQYNILRILKGSSPGKLSMQDIVRRMLDKSPNATRLAEKLLKKEFIDRVISPADRRVIYLSISKKGIEFIEKVNIHFNKEVDRMGLKLSVAEAENLNQLLDKIRN